MFNLFKKRKTLVTHSGSFHADDVFACATLELLLEKRGECYRVVRTRDPKIISAGDFVFDVGGEYDPKRNRFDHHQSGGAGTYNSNIPYAAVGLVWKQFGKELCGSSEVASMVEGQIIMPIDAHDNGIDVSKSLVGDLQPYSIQGICNSFRPTWKEKNLTDDEQFLKVVELAKMFLNRSIISSQDTFEAYSIIKEIYKNAPDKRLIVIDQAFDREDILPVLGQYKEPLFFIYPKTTQGWWKLEAIRKNMNSFELRKDLPKSWAGLRDVDLQNKTGVLDATFCHNGLFLAVSKTKEGALKLAKLALEYNG
jgi:uncharacterized UPF0160 family protein